MQDENKKKMAIYEKISAHIFEIICVYSPDNREYYAIFGADALFGGRGLPL
jgi:hypothetical protein